ncbi:MAG TPA: sugar transferase [Pyrinomonadaceae bacterium]|jgi:exopolysaccharide biosynthesis polyprenyl glycosylphosphotransferase|nr:sugar transferase [Pyrinomonadaceae bacterium]
MKAETFVTDFTNASAVRVPARAPRWVVPLVKLGLLLGDATLALACFVAAFYVRHYQSIIHQSAGGSLSWSHDFAPYAVLLPLIIPIRLLLLRYYDLYRVRGEFSVVDDIASVFKATAISSLLIVAAAFMYRGGVAFRTFSYSRGIFLLDFVLVFVTISAMRMAFRTGQIMVRRRGINLIPTLIVGRGAEAALCIREMRARPELGYRVIGIVDNQRADVLAGASFEGVPVIGSMETLPEAIRESRANEVIISDPNVPGEKLFDVMIQTGRRRGVEFRIAPTLLNCLPSKTEIDQVGSLPMVTLFRSPLSSGARVVKRSSDLFIATLALVVLSPLWLLLALLIKLDSSGPVFYKQERVGMDGRIFLFYKFRSMQVGSDDATHREYQRAYISGRAESNLGDDERPVFKLRTDTRITRVGRLLRKTSLDELPQLFNVMRGDMSVVGPRPPIPYEVENYQLWHRKRLDMKPGITGLWQVSGRNRLPFDEMVRMDLYYIENWSLLLDIKIILQTLPVMWRGEAY